MTTSDTNIPPGFISQSHFESIIELARSIPAGSDVLEIGAGFGRSTYAWLTGLKDCYLYILDSWEWHNFHEGLYARLKNYNINLKDWEKIKSIGNHYGSWKYFITRNPNHKQIKKVFSMTTQDYLKSNLKKTYKCVYIDDSHDPEELTRLLTHFVGCEIICGDDYNDSWQEICQVIDKFTIENKKHLTTNRNGFWKIV